MAGELHAPHDRISLRIDHFDGRLTRIDLAAEARDDLAFVGCDEHVVHRMVHSDAANHLVRGDVDDIDNGGKLVAIARLEPRSGDLGSLRDDARIDLPVFLVHRDLVGPLRQRDLLNELQRLGVEHVDGLVLLVRAVVVETVGVHRQVVGMRTAPDDSDDLVDGWIDDVMDVAGVIALQDPHRDAVIRVEARHALSRGRCGEKKCTTEG